MGRAMGIRFILHYSNFCVTLWYDTTMAQNSDTILSSNTLGYSVLPYKYNISITTTIY